MEEGIMRIEDDVNSIVNYRYLVWLRENKFIWVW